MVWGYQTLKDGFFITTYTHVYILILLPHITHSHGLLFYSVFPFTHSLLLSHDMKFSIKNLNMCAYISIILPLPLYKGTYKFIYFDKSHSTNVKSRHQLIAFIQPFNQLTKRSFHTCAYLCVCIYDNARSQCLMLNKFINHMKNFHIMHASIPRSLVYQFKMYIHVDVPKKRRFIPTDA